MNWDPAAAAAGAAVAAVALVEDQLHGYGRRHDGRRPVGGRGRGGRRGRLTRVDEAVAAAVRDERDLEGRSCRVTFRLASRYV